ncbi:VOC family protein [Clavibacter sp. MX14-G9D]|uniref:VOC family protein n=1 Tax=Clavibacter sp. MX14-G9D TaxID=3064656 RepID=UPI00293EC81A|nr:VOC family protein [Clavibacter sp. MX14-G9D]
MVLHMRQIVLDAEDARELAAFYLALLGGEYRAGDEPAADGSDDNADWVAIRTAEGVDITVQRVDELPRVTWPHGPVRQQLHLDFTVTDADQLERHRDRAVALGATVLDDQSADPDGALYVLADPAGHPFCMFVADDGSAQPNAS